MRRSPYVEYIVNDDDLIFSAQALAALGPGVVLWRSRQREASAALVDDVQPLEQALRSRMPQHIRDAPERTAPVVLAVFLRCAQC